MKYTALTTLFLGLGMALCAQSAHAWFVGAAQGGTDRNDRVQLAWTLGEPATGSGLAGSGMLTEGFHQPDLQTVKLPVSMFVEKNPGSTARLHSPEVAVFPNPTAGILQITIGETEPGAQVRITLTDQNGRLLEERQVQTPATPMLDLFSRPPGTYLLQLQSADSWSPTTYHVIKH